MNRSRIRKLSFVLLLGLVFSFFGRAAHAQEADATVEVFRLNNPFILLKITFADEISGSFAGEMAGKHFDCLTIPPHVLICIGRFRAGPDPALLTIYDQETKEIVLQKVINSPPGKGGGDEPPAPQPVPDPESPQ